MLRNDFATFEANMAAGQLGAYAVPINWHFTAEEAGYILADCRAKALVIHADLLPQVAAGVPEGTKVLVVPTPDEIGDAYSLPAEKRLAAEGVELWDAFVARSAPNTAPPKASRGSMIYTSGTTGRPKGVQRDALDARAAGQGGGRDRQALGPGERSRRSCVLMNGPMYHSAPTAYGLQQRAARAQRRAAAALRRRGHAAADRAAQGHATCTSCRPCSCGCCACRTR